MRKAWCEVTITFGKKAVERDIFQLCRRIREGIVGDDLHAEALADVGEDAPDLASADNTRGFAV